MYDEPFIYDDYISNTINSINMNVKKMYDRGPIMSRAERSQLNDHATELFFNNHMTSMTNGRYEIKIVDEDDRLIPLVFEIRNRIEQRENLLSFKRERHVSDFMAMVPKNGFIHKHTDPNDLCNNLFHIRFNVFITIPQNDMNTYYDGHIIDANERCYVLCRSGIDYHWSDINTSDTPRISLSYGYLLPADKVDKLTSNPLIGTYTQFYPLALTPLTSINVLNTFINEFDIEERGNTGSCIFTSSNVFTDNQCNFIMNYMNKHMLSEDSSNYVNTINTNNTGCHFITLKKMISLNISDSERMDAYIFDIVGTILKKIKAIRENFKGTQDDGYVLCKNNGDITLHSERINSTISGYRNYIRCLSLIIVLNDDYDGGIFNFPNQNLNLKLKNGEVIIFPPYWTHPYSVSSVGECQSRYTINTCILEKFID